ncbi:isopenicillin N synthase family dioxygenase [Prosthecodimorpha staleyi]|uniref:Isopenicillin N synthase family oxygenase n=1 Tax=Prosthecodimorpha staleyi TaxID=2840188 RepID=A0A947GBH0_9HYPH|nr:2-oxoglutarate and iron-dependent oxygenase domain-containing protein [Prosthecodimorpha staleyi]MBT9290268.1 isopenicillin N synthase family oxygenase [Prosthecodimorpha staleyi]
MSDQLPVIDLSGRDLPRLAALIGAACREIGFFYVIGHGVPQALIDETFARARWFFALDPTEKARVAIERVGNNRGYAALKSEALDPARPADLKEAFNVGLELAADHPDLQAGVPFRGLNGWPANPAFRATLLAYFDETQALGAWLHRAFACDLGLPPDHFEFLIDRPMSTLRLLHYPPQPVEAEPGQIGAGEHTDYGNITLLMTDDVGGLQVRRRDGVWIEAPVVPGAYVVNIGDCLMRWTNDVYVSTPHRVVNASGRERFSIAYFLDPNPDALVAALPGTVAPGAQPNHPPVAAADYLAGRLDATYAHRRGGTDG